MYYLFIANNSSDGVVYVRSEVELVAAIDNAKTGTPVVITLDNDIGLTARIMIPAQKNITLTSNGDNVFRLVGADRASTIFVEADGVLILDGVVVTHVKGCEGRGVFVGRGGLLIMYSGEISGNAATGDRSIYVGDCYGGGVENQGVFEMYGGKISGSKAQHGGGVSNGYFGTFNMYGGEISGNNAIWSGGGVYNWNGEFNRSGGTISGNSAQHGANVYNET